MKDSHESAVSQFDDLRKRAVAVGGDAEATLKNLARYYEQLCFAESRFPIGGESNAVQIKFRWSDAFNEKDKRYFYTVSQEKMCVLFNMGAAHTAAAVETDRGDGKGLQDAAKHFRLAAGIFAAVRAALADEDEKVFKKARDFNVNSLELCEAVALASAQTCVYERAVMAKMSPKTLRKIAMGCMKCYETAAKHAKDSDSKTVSSNWSSKLDVHVSSFGAAAHFWQSQVDHDKAHKEGTGYGIEVARLHEALRLIRDAHDTLDNGPKWDGKEDVGESIEALEKKVKEKFETANTDNNSVYMEEVPDASSLEDIDAKVLVKNIDFDIVNDLGGRHGDDLFNSIVPQVVTEAVVEFQSLVDKRVEEAKTSVKENNDLAKAKLASLGLPAALESEESNGGIPDSLRKQIRAARVLSGGGVRGLREKLDRAQSMVQQAEARHARVRRMLDDEASSDSRYRSEHGGRWHRERSENAARRYREDLNMYGSKINGARMANERIRGRFRSSSAALAFLDKSDAALEAMFPRRNSSGPDKSSSSRLALQRMLLDVSKSIETRDEMLKKLTEAAKDIDISRVMSKEGAVKFSANSTIIRDKDTLFATELSKLDEFIDAITDSVKTQSKLMKDIVDANSSYRDSRNASEATKKRESVLSEIQIAVLEGTEIAEHVREGEGFFNALEEKLRVLESSVSDYVSRRKRDADEIIAGLSRMNMTPTVVSVGDPYQTNHSPILDATPIMSSGSMSNQSYTATIVAPPPTQQSGTTTTAPPSYNYDRAPSYGSSTYGQTNTSPPSVPSYGAKTQDAPPSYDSNTASSNSLYGQTSPPSYGGRNSSSATSLPSVPSYGAQTQDSFRSLNDAPPSYGGYNSNAPPYPSNTSNTSNTSNSLYDQNAPPSYGTKEDSSAPPQYGTYGSYNRH